MSFQHDPLPLPDPGYAQPFRPALGAPERRLGNQCRQNTKGFPSLVHRHLQPPFDDGQGGIEPGRGASQVVTDSQQPVSPSPVFREGTMQHCSGIAGELQQLVFKAIGEIRPGMGVQAQLNAACDNLGYKRGHWRVRAAFYGNAKNWRSEPVFEMMGRYNRLVQKRSASGSHTAGTTPAADPPIYHLMVNARR